MKNPKAITIIVTIFACLMIGTGIFVLKKDAIQARFFSDQPTELPQAIDVAQSQAENTSDTGQVLGEKVNVAATKLPSQFNLAVPFVLQAPTANWDAVHNETCEEAAALTVHYYWTKVKNPTASQIETQFTKLIKYQNKKFGDYKDTTAAQTAQFIKDVWGYKKVEVLPIKSWNDIKVQVKAGRPVILPTAGKLLKNPNFKNGGPKYHNLVVRGWLADGRIITNDPGTRKGNGYVYKPQILWNAIHDWNSGDILNGKKVMIVVYPNK
ncbi:MAG: C39 family peptidase [Patescibacteria group bacterium]|jgi:hypothetical protein